MITIATVSGPAASIVCSRSSSRKAVNSVLGLVRRAVVAVRVARVRTSGHERLERRAQRRDAVDRERAHGRPVVGDVARDHLPAPLAAGRVVLAGELPGRLDRLGAARDEEDAVEVAGSQRGDLGRELDRARVRVRPVGVEGQLAQLRGGRLADLVAERVPDLDREEARRARRGSAGPRRPRGSSPSPRTMIGGPPFAVLAHPREVQPEVVARRALPVVDGRGGLGRGHAAPFVRRFWMRMFASIAPRATTKIAVAITFTCGGAPTRAAPQTNSGNVTSEPELK